MTYPNDFVALDAVLRALSNLLDACQFDDVQEVGGAALQAAYKAAEKTEREAQKYISARSAENIMSALRSMWPSERGQILPEFVALLLMAFVVAAVCHFLGVL